MTIKEIILYFGIYLLMAGVLAFFFYKTVASFLIIAAIFAYPYYRYVQNRNIREKKWKATLEFKELIRLLSSELQAGQSVENAFISVRKEMKGLFGKTIITDQCDLIVNGLSNNEPIEKLMYEMSDKMKIDEITDFVEVFTIAKKTGGNLKNIIREATSAIDTKIELKREYRVLIASKQFEHRIMCLIPFGIIGYIGITSKGYFDFFYSGLVGRGIMSIIMAVYLGALTWGERIINTDI